MLKTLLQSLLICVYKCISILYIIMYFRSRNALSLCTVEYSIAGIVWLARLSLSAQGRKGEQEKDSLEYIVISSHLAT